MHSTKWTKMVGEQESLCVHCRGSPRKTGYSHGDGTGNGIVYWIPSIVQDHWLVFFFLQIKVTGWSPKNHWRERFLLNLMFLQITALCIHAAWPFLSQLSKTQTLAALEPAPTGHPILFWKLWLCGLSCVICPHILQMFHAPCLSSLLVGQVHLGC